MRTLTVTMFLLSVMVLGMVIVHAVRVLVLRMGLVVMMMVAVLVLPEYLLVMAYHGPDEMMERVRMVVTSAVSVAIYIHDHPFFAIVVIYERTISHKATILYSRYASSTCCDCNVSLNSLFLIHAIA